ncbi:F-box/FBD/LRR-repeat protein At1g16930 [Helianthus annuus]|uniref:F-box/FBD/LRR-repeat protein At1g16930 n=1 Tax=Helianthus annuus TaxID=4232 RepID=UPI000B8F004D|nr:F-box/FBD/LRR-repeat protein At1g16930 [Helianthus annuus]
MVTPLDKAIERYIDGLPDTVQDIVTGSNPTTVRQEIELATTLTESQVRKGKLTRKGDMKQSADSVQDKGKGRWIHAAVMRKVKLLDLSFSPRVEDDEVIKLPHSLVTCDTLEVLRLYLYSCPLRLPAVTGFPALRVLELNSVELLNGDSVQQFLKNCPLLEDLSLVDCSLPSIDDLCISCLNLKTLKIDNRKMLDESYDGRYVCFYTYDRLQISCPKLVFLEYAGHPAYELSFEHLDSLKKAVIYPDATAHQELSFQSFGGTMCRLFEGVSHVESLSLNLYFIKAISAACDANGNFPASLPNLKTLEISTTIDDYPMNAVIQILRCSPNLESFHLVIQEETFWPEAWESDEDESKMVEFLEFHGEK